MGLLPFLVSGLGIGAVYALSGVGLVVLYRASGVLNFAFGALGAIAAHLAWSATRWGVPVGVSLLLGVAMAAAVSFGYGAVVAPLLRERDGAVRSVATLGLTLVLLGVMGLVWGEVPRRLVLPTDVVSWAALGARIDGTRIAALAIAALAVWGVGLFLATTRIGLFMRAVANNRDLSEMLGVRTRQVDAMAWLMSGGLAGVSGIVLADIVRLQPAFLTFLLIPAISAAILGRLSSLATAAAAGLVIGMVEAGLTALPAVAPYRSVTPYLIALLFVTISLRGLAEVSDV